MLTKSRIKVYINAYIKRMNKGETMEEIDNSFISIRRLTQEEADYIHTLLPREYRQPLKRGYR